MTNKLEPQKKNNSSIRDLVAIFIIFIFALVVSYFFNVLNFLVEFFQKNPNSITWIDEILIGSLTLIIGFAIFSWRRLLELRKETAERLSLQEDLISLAETKAETERIICKQLHCDIAEYKKIEQDILSRKPKVKGVTFKSRFFT